MTTSIADVRELANRLSRPGRSVRANGTALSAFYSPDSENWRIRVAIENHRLKVTAFVVGVVPDRQPTEEWSLSFPFSYAEWTAIIRDAQRTAKREWRATHGCAACSEREDDYGYRRINPKCEECGGEGTVLG